MLKFALRRFIGALAVLVAVSILSFALFQFVGDPVTNLASIEATAADRERLRQELGLDDHVVIQFARYLGRALRGDFGVSYRLRQPVERLISARAPATLELSFMAALLALTIGVPLGVYTGIYSRSWVARTILTVSLVGVSIPTFLIGILLILLFSVQLGWLPSFGRGEVVEFSWWSTGFLTASGVKAIILPAVTLSLFQMTLLMRLVRSEMLEVLRTDYIKFARARGLTNRAVHYGHALRNTLIPVITVTGLQLGSIIAFAIVTETVFQWPGLGLLFVQAMGTGDVPLMACYLMLISLIFVSINLVVDLLYFAVDPRLRSDTAEVRMG
jgi:peptide/nickel transport system permease protein